MKNIEMEVKGNVLTVKIDLSKTFGASTSGKSIIIGRNIEAAQEYEDTGHWTAFMGVVLDTPPVDTSLIPYN